MKSEKIIIEVFNIEELQKSKNEIIKTIQEIARIRIIQETKNIVRLKNLNLYIDTETIEIIKKQYLPYNIKFKLTNNSVFISNVKELKEKCLNQLKTLKQEVSRINKILEQEEEYQKQRKNLLKIKYFFEEHNKI